MPRSRCDQGGGVARPDPDAVNWEDTLTWTCTWQAFDTSLLSRSQKLVCDEFITAICKVARSQGLGLTQGSQESGPGSDPAQPSLGSEAEAKARGKALAPLNAWDLKAGGRKESLQEERRGWRGH